MNATYPTASIALLTALGRYLGVDLPVGQLATRALERRNLLDAATASDEQTKSYVERLEAFADESRLPAGDELIADIERFLRRVHLTMTRARVEADPASTNAQIDDGLVPLHATSGGRMHRTTTVAAQVRAARALPVDTSHSPASGGSAGTAPRNSGCSAD